MTRRLRLGLIVVTAAVVAGVWLFQSSTRDDDVAPPGPQDSRPAVLDSSGDLREPMAAAPGDDAFADERAEMVATQLRTRDITDERVLDAMATVPRHLFVPERSKSLAYGDHPLPIGHDQTISQPYIVALMTQLARPQPQSRVLDIGTGSGYQAAVLALLVDQVYSIEIICELADEARDRLQRLGYDNVDVRCGDGYLGWPEHAPFDAIIVAAAPDHIPQPLIDQLAAGGRLVLPVGDFFQELIVVEKHPDGNVTRTSVAPVRFVPMTGEAQHRQSQAPD